MHESCNYPILKNIYHKLKAYKSGKYWLAVLVLALIGFFVLYELAAYPLKSLYQKEKMYYSILSSVKKPTFPQRNCDVTKYGAVGDGSTINTQAIADAIDDCSQKGGGAVEFPNGDWFTGPIRLKDNINLHLADSAKIIFSDDRNDYLPAVFTRFQGMELYNFSPLINAENVTNVAITGKGTIDGNGKSWIDWNKISSGTHPRSRLLEMANTGVPVEQRVFGENDKIRPSFIQFVNSKNILMEDVTIQNSPMWTIHPIYSENMMINHVTVNNSGTNTDCIDIDSSRNVLVQNSTFSSNDDAIAIKSGLENDGWRVNKPAENIVIRNCAMIKGHSGVAIGSEMSGSVRNVVIKGNTFKNTTAGFSVKSLAGRGGVVENIWLDNIQMSKVPTAISLDMGYMAKVQGNVEHIPIFRNMLITNIEIRGAKKTLLIDSLGTDDIYDINISNLRSNSKKAEVINAGTVNVKRSDIEVK